MSLCAMVWVVIHQEGYLQAVFTSGEEAEKYRSRLRYPEENVVESAPLYQTADEAEEGET